VKLFKECLAEFGDLLWPARCLLCARPATHLDCCASHELPEGLVGSRCPRCAARLPDAIGDGVLCARCRLRPPAFDLSTACWDYWGQAAAREHILAAKHRSRVELWHQLGHRLGEQLISEGAQRPLIVPVPCHLSRKIERGYDSTALLASAAAERCGGRLVHALRRVRPTRSQGDPLVVDRARNVRGSIRPRRGAASSQLEGRSVWLVDDVMTSGSTANECARALKDSGVKRVQVCVLACATLRSFDEDVQSEA
jgi:ComF family protein